jgi:hypothetical protein
MSRIAGFHPALTDLDTTPQVALGGILEADNKVYKYVKFTGSNAVAVGDLVGFVASLDGNTVDGAVGVGPAGVALAIVASGAVAYGFIQIRGTCVAASAIAGGAADGQTLKQGTYPAFTLQTAATIANAGFGYDVSEKLVMLTCPY